MSESKDSLIVHEVDIDGDNLPEVFVKAGRDFAIEMILLAKKIALEVNPKLPGFTWAILDEVINNISKKMPTITTDDPRKK